MSVRSHGLFLCLFYIVSLLLVSGPVYGVRTREGDVLKIFNGQRVYVITNVDNDAPALADLLLENCPIKERRVLSVDEWNALPRETRWYVTCVYLIDRERLPVGQSYPANCRAEMTEDWTEVIRTGRDWGIAYDVTLSAPDLAHLRRLIQSFRTLKEAPRKPLTQSVRSFAVVPVGIGAEHAVPAYLSVPAGDPRIPHLLPVREYSARQSRLTESDELILLDRSTASATVLPTAFAPVSDRLFSSKGDVIAWRETKPGGYIRAYVSAPTPEMLTAILRKSPKNLLALAAFDTPVVLASACDLRAVRRIAVATVGGSRIEDEIANRIAGLAASKMRELNSFEVLERSALTTVLAEIALDQAGLTRGTNRAKIRQLAAADALLIVDLTRSDGGTQFNCTATRVTAPLPGPPRRPSEPSRLKREISIGDQNDGIIRAVAENLLKSVVGTKTDEEYSAAMRDYRRNTLPQWERSVADYNAQAENRKVEWRQTITARSTARIAGSVRLVDLTDGLVLWERQIASSDGVDRTQQSRTVFTRGENSSAPGADDLPGANGDIPGELLARVAETAVGDALQAMPETALLPITVPDGEANKNPAVGTPLKSGKVIDVDGPLILIGLGASDGLKVGDIMLIRLSDGADVAVAVTRIRPRTCDATVVKSIKPGKSSLIQIGDTVVPAPIAR